MWKFVQDWLRGPEPLPEPKIIESALSKMERATYARQLMTNPLWDEVFDNLRDDAFKLWVGTNTEDVGHREYLWKHFQIIGVLQRRVKAYIETVSLEEAMEEKKQKTRNP